MTPSQLLQAFFREFETRRFSAGLLVAFIRFYRELGVFGQGFSGLDSVLQAFPQSEVSARGAKANTLTVRVASTEGESRLLSVRPAYNEIEQYFRVTHKRFDFPNCAPHATGQWHDYRSWLDTLAGFSSQQAESLEQAVIGHVLGRLESHEVDVSELRPLERWFTRLLEDFDLSRHGREPQGAAFQGVVYAYIRADAPHLHLDVARAGAGSKRLNRVGDIDGWDGERLVLSVEAKHLEITDSNVASVEPFLTEVSRRNALSIVAAISVSAVARQRVEDEGGRVLHVPLLLDLVDLWDPLKQRAALQAFIYYVHHIEKNGPLMERLGAFLEELGYT